LASCN